MIDSRIIEYLKGWLQRIAHLPLDKQLQEFDKDLCKFEEDLKGLEAQDMPDQEMRHKLVVSLQHYPLVQAKALFIGVFSPWVERMETLIEYLSILGERFPSSSRISSLREGYVFMKERFSSLIKVIEQY